METALRRAREAEGDGNDALNRISVSILFDQVDDHTHDLIGWMRSICGGQPEDYANEKRSLAKSLGYDEVRIKGSFQIRSEDLQAFIDHSVGLLPTAPISNMVVRDVRFGIAARNPIFDGKPDFASFTVTPTLASIAFVGHNGDTATLVGEMRSIAMPGLPSAFYKAVFTSPGITFAISRSELDLTYEIKATQEYALNGLRAFCDFSRVTASPTEMILSREGHTPIKVDMPAQQLNNVRWAGWLGTILDSLAKVCPSASPSFSIVQISASRERLEEFTNCVSDGEFTFRFTLSRQMAPFPEIRNMLGYAAVELNSKVYWAIVRRPCLRHEVNRARHVVIFGNPIILEAGFEDGPVSLHLKRISERLQALSTQIGDGVAIMNGGNQSQLGASPFDIQLT